MAYDVGDRVRWTCTYTDSDGAAQDPTSVYFSIEDPSGNVVTYQYGVDAEVIRDSTGVYHVDVDKDEAGTWTVRGYSTGTGKAAVEAFCRVREREVP